ncbi:MAG TPA: glycosyl hydrolase family 28 protein [Hanamia sp.]|nr:glycosyl hydrolase family 28 protein [Hanamia sp.]
MKKGIISLCLFFYFFSSHAQTYDIKDFGAIADGKTVNTFFIQKTIDECANKGGGTVEVPAGIFITGTFSLKSNVNLHLDNGAVLKGSPDLKDYKSYEMPGYGINYYGILYTRGVENVSITGMGTINGNDTVFFEWDKAKKIDSTDTRFTRQKNNFRKVESGIGDGPVVPKDRPHQMVIFSQCKNVQVRNISLVHSPLWTLHFADCDAVLVNDIRLWSGMLVPNADGIDVTSCSNVTISDCDIRTGDDAIAITGYNHHFEIPGFSGIRKTCENILVSNCNLQSSSSGIRIGFLDQNTVRNIHVDNVNITNSTRGIGIFLRDEGSLENITFSNMYIETKLRTGDWWGNGEPIHISAIRGKENVKLGQIKNVLFNHIICKGENGILVYGTDESIINNVEFNDITFDLVNSKLNAVAGGNIDLRGVMGVQNGLFKSDIPGLLAKDVKNLVIHNFKLNWIDPQMPYFTDGIEVENFNGLKVTDFTGTGAPNNPNAYPVEVKNGKHFVTDLSKKSVHEVNVK